MNIGNTGYSITCKVNGEIFTDLNPTHTLALETDIKRINELTAFYNKMRSCPVTGRDLLFQTLKDAGQLDDLLGVVVAEATAEATAEAVVNDAPIDPQAIVKSALAKLIDFFSEFSFEPNYRFVNTLARSLSKSQAEAKSYIKQYFELINSPYANSVSEKIRSKEFSSILSDLKSLKPTHIVNNRFKIYYGSQGTGKTTMAMQESNGKCIVCHSAMLPSDLMEDFKFNDGKAEFQPSELYRAIVEGRPIVLDEINLLPFESLRFLQGIVDGKDEFIYKGNLVKIADGFKIIGTMNLTVNGMTYGLPEPLIDRCECTKKFVLTADSLMGAII